MKEGWREKGREGERVNDEGTHMEEGTKQGTDGRKGGGEEGRRGGGEKGEGRRRATVNTYLCSSSLRKPRSP